MSSLSIAQRLQKITPTKIPMGKAAEANTMSLSLQILEFFGEKSANIQLVKKRNCRHMLRKVRYLKCPPNFSLVGDISSGSSRIKTSQQIATRKLVLPKRCISLVTRLIFLKKLHDQLNVLNQEQVNILSIQKHEIIRQTIRFKQFKVRIQIVVKIMNLSICCYG